MFITAGFLIVVAITLAIAVATVSGAFVPFRPVRAMQAGAQGQAVPSVPWDAEGIFIYALSFAGLAAMLYAVAGLAATLVVTVTQQSSALIGTSEVRDRTSYYLASIVVGAPIWLVLWRLAQRRVATSPLQRHAPERLWYLSAIFAVTSVVALFGLLSLLQGLMTLPGSANKTLTVRDDLFAGARLLVWGTVWLAYARLGWRERHPQDRDKTHDIAIYIVSGFALIVLVIGLVGAARHLIGDAVAAQTLAGGNSSLWSDWGDICASVVSGGLVWAAVWQYDLARGGRRLFRVIYLYLVLLVAASATLFSGVDFLYEVLQRIFGHTTSNIWLFLQDVLPLLLIAGTIWAYHWTIVRRQPAPAGQADIPRGALPWPRHPAIVLLTLAGLVMTAAAFTSLVWLALDSLLHVDTALSGGSWWRDRLSLGLAAGLVGAAIWLPAWTLLQRSAVADPTREQRLEIRFRLLGVIVLASTLVAIGFAVALVWTVFRTLLGGSFNADTVGWLLKDVSAALVTLTLAGYHATYLRAERRLHLAQPNRMRVLALTAPATDEMLAEISRVAGRTIEVLGRLQGEGVGGTMDPAAIERQLAELEERAAADGALLIVRPNGVEVYPYMKASSVEAPSTAQPDRPIPEIANGSGTEGSVVTPA